MKTYLNPCWVGGRQRPPAVETITVREITTGLPGVVGGQAAHMDHQHHHHHHHHHNVGQTLAISAGNGPQSEQKKRGRWYHKNKVPVFGPSPHLSMLLLSARPARPPCCPPEWVCIAVCTIAQTAQKSTQFSLYFLTKTNEKKKKRRCQSGA